MLYDQNKVQIGVWLEPEVVANCDTYAKYLSQSRFRFINEALKLYIKHAEKHCELLAENEKTNSIRTDTQKKRWQRNTSSALYCFFINPNFVRKNLGRF